VPGIDVTDQGYVFSQSWLNTYFNCPEQARLEMVGEMPRIESDATAIGTAIHSGIEAVLRGGTETVGYDTCIDTFNELAATPEFQWVQIKSEHTAWNMIGRLWDAWCTDIHPQLPHVEHIEHKFELQLADNMWMRGAIDAIDEHGNVWDWKTAGRPYEAWEKERFAIQPTVYTAAVAQMGEYEPRDSWEFSYAVMLKSGRTSTQIVTVQRTQAHWDWLAAQCESIVQLIQANLNVWPLRDQHALCSPKWCKAWDKCKGKFL
jgi:hypothetical protein